MGYSDFDKAMKALEWWNHQSVPAGAYPILRIDGRGFSKVTQRLGLEKPYDRDFHSWMGTVTKTLVGDLGAVVGYHQSDEISLLLPKDTQLFDRGLEKLASVSAGLASSVFMRMLLETQRGGEALDGRPDEFPHFDSRLLVAINDNIMLDYFGWRQADATRNALNSWCHWTAIQQDGLSATAAGRLFEKQGVEFKNEFLFKHNINFNELPLWQKRGTIIHWNKFEKDGYNPKTKEAVKVMRRVLAFDHQIPRGEPYREYLTKLLPVETEE